MPPFPGAAPRRPTGPSRGGDLDRPWRMPPASGGAGEPEGGGPLGGGAGPGGGCTECSFCSSCPFPGRPRRVTELPTRHLKSHVYLENPSLPVPPPRRPLATRRAMCQRQAPVWSPACETARFALAARTSIPSRTGSVCTTNGNKPSEQAWGAPEDVSSLTPGFPLFGAVPGGTFGPVPPQTA